MLMPATWIIDLNGSLPEPVITVAPSGIGPIAKANTLHILRILRNPTRWMATRSVSPPDIGNLGLTRWMRKLRPLSEETEMVERYLKFFNDVLPQPDDTLNNALCVSFIGDLALEGNDARHGAVRDCAPKRIRNMLVTSTLRWVDTKHEF